MSKTKRELFADMKAEMKAAFPNVGFRFSKMPGEWQARYKAVKYAVEHKDEGDVMVDNNGEDVSKPVNVAIPEKKEMPKDPHDDTVTVGKTELNKILERLAELENDKKHDDRKQKIQSDKWEVDDEGKRILTATLRRKDVDDKIYYATELKFVRKQFNENLREVELIYKVTWLGVDETIDEEMPLPQFMTYEREEVKITGEKVVKLKKTVGTTNLVKVDYDKYSSRVIGKVPVTVTAEDITYDVLLPDGRILKKFPAAGLNR